MFRPRQLATPFLYSLTWEGEGGVEANLDRIDCAARRESRSMCQVRFRIGPDTSTVPPRIAVRLKDDQPGAALARTQL